jgi:hypothetical protein
VLVSHGSEKISVPEAVLDVVYIETALHTVKRIRFPDYFHERINGIYSSEPLDCRWETERLLCGVPRPPRDDGSDPKKGVSSLSI